jgi:hypothetical protein
MAYSLQKVFYFLEDAMAWDYKGQAISWDDLNAITHKHTAFCSYHGLLLAEGGYFPSLDVSIPELLILADHYDRAQERCGDPRRAFRYVL